MFGGGRQVGRLLEAQFHYQYQAADGRLVRIAEGDRFVLLNKSNQDWWQVRREGEPKRSKPIYVPAAYVVELPETAAVASVGKRASLPGKFSASSLDISGTWSGGTKDKRSTFSGDLAFRPRLSWANLGRAVPPSPRASRLPPPRPSQRCTGNVAAIVHSWPPATPLESRGQADGATDGECYVEPQGEKRRPRSPVYTNLKELKVTVQSPPSPTAPPVQILDLWERHICPDTGRNFYLNSVTKERTWKPPRRTRNRVQSRSSTPPPNQPSPWNDGEHSQTPGNRLEIQQQNRKSWDTSQSSSSRMQRSTSSDSMGPGSQGTNGRQVWRRQVTVNWTCQAKSTVPHENTGQQVKDWRSQSQHSRTMSDSSSVSSPAVEKAGQLNKTKIAEGGRKLKKNWGSCWVVLAGNSLAFYKEVKSQGTGTKRAGNHPESSMDLRGALIEWTKDMSSKKHVFRIRTVTGNEFLLQSENEDYINDWYRTIKSVIDTLDRENPLNYPLVYALRRSASAELLECSGDEDEVVPPKDTKQKESRRISLRRMNSDSSERKRVKNRIRKFISKRPPLQTLHEKGLIKDQVFGCRLDALCEREKSTVPKFVRQCIEAVEKRGLDVDGIYRVSGNLAIIQKLRFAVDHERAVTTDGRYLFPEETCRGKLNLDEPEWEDIHVVTGALKMFFRELPEPLVPYEAFEDFVSAIKLVEHSQRLEAMKQLVGNLPRPNQETMKAMFKHMQKVVEHSQTNRMSAQSLAIVFGPTLLRPEKDFLNMAVHTVYQNQIVELILIEYSSLFAPESRPP